MGSRIRGVPWGGLACLVSAVGCAEPGMGAVDGGLCCYVIACTGSFSVATRRSATGSGASSVSIDASEDPTGLDGGRDDHDFYISVEQVSGAGSCVDLALAVSNGA